MTATPTEHDILFMQWAERDARKRALMQKYPWFPIAFPQNALMLWLIVAPKRASTPLSTYENALYGSARDLVLIRRLMRALVTRSLEQS